MKLRHLPALALLSATAAQAADAGYLDFASFQIAAGATSVESFETTATRLRTLDPIYTPLFTLNTAVAPIGVQDGPTTPLEG